MVALEVLRGLWKARRRGNQQLSFRNRRRVKYPKEPWVSEDLAGAVDDLESSYASGRVSSSIYASLIRRCTRERAFSYGVRVHRHMDATKYLDDTFMGNLLIDFYGKCGNLDWACDVFDAMDKRNVFTWNSLLRLLEEQQLPRKVFRAFRRMQSQGGLPDCSSYTYAVRACGRLRYLKEGTAFHHELIDAKIQQDHVLQSALIYMYGKCKRLDVAIQVFEDVRFREAAVWNAMIMAVCRGKEFGRAMEIFGGMLQEGKRPDKTTYSIVLEICLCSERLAEGRALADRIVATGFDRSGSRKLQHSLVKLYARCNLFKQARDILERIPQCNKSSWNSCIASYVRQGCNEEAIDLYHAMRARASNPDSATFAAVLAACCGPQHLMHGKAIHARVVATIVQPDGKLVSALIKMFSDCGSLRDAKFVFDKRKTKRLQPWNTMMAAYVQHGCFRECVELFEQLQLDKILTANDATYSSVFAACCRDEFRSKANWILSMFAVNKRALSLSMQSDALNMFAVRGEFENAKWMFDQMSLRDEREWNALAMACVRGGCEEKLPQFIQFMELEGFDPDYAYFL